MTVRVIQGDARAMLGSLPDASVHMVCTSPPYFGLRAYVPDGHPDKELEIGGEPSPAEYVAALVEVFREVRRVLHPSGVAFLNIGDSYASTPPGNTTKGVSAKSGLNGVNGASGRYRETLAAGHATKRDTSRLPGIKPKDLLLMPARVALALQAGFSRCDGCDLELRSDLWPVWHGRKVCMDCRQSKVVESEKGWWVRSDCIWHKPSCLPESVTDRPTSAHEHVFLLAKSGTPTYWTHRDGAGARVQPPPDYRWLDADADGAETAVEPPGWKDARSCKGEKSKRWRRLNLWDAHDYFWDACAASEKSGGNAMPARGTNLTALGSAALIPEANSTISADDRSPRFRGRGNLGETEITINGSVTWEAEDLEIILSIRFSVIIEKSEWKFVVDLQPLPGGADRAAITSQLKSLAAGHFPVRATIINTAAAVGRTSLSNTVFAVPLTDTSARAEPVLEPRQVLTDMIEEGNTAEVTFYCDELCKPLLVLGTFRPAHGVHDTKNISLMQQSSRNLRNVWTIPTSPSPIQHHAMMPPALAERCIRAGSSEKGCCPNCLAPWARVLERTALAGVRGGDGTSIARAGTGRSQDRDIGGDTEWAKAVPPKMLGWQPTCSCPPHEPRPCTVLDFFAGAGTTLLVADRLGRDAIGIELSAANVAITRERLQGDAPLFVQVAAE